MSRRNSFIVSLVMLSVFFGEISGAAGESSDYLIAFEQGRPFFRHFSYQEHKGGVQNWDLVIDSKGILYCGNNDGILEFDGVRWRLIQTNNKTVVRSLAMGNDGRIYVGAKGEIGYLAPDNSGKLSFVSLLDYLPETERNFSDVFRTLVSAEGVWFQCSEFLFLLAEKKSKIFKPKTSFHYAFLVNKRLFIREVDTGLMELKADRLQLIEGGELFAQERIAFMLPLTADSSKILIGTRTKGLFVYENEKIEPFFTEIDSQLKTSLITHGVLVRDKCIAIATIKSGLVLIDHEGRLSVVLSTKEGLPTSTIYKILADENTGLWLATDRGVTHVEYPAPLSVFDEGSGLKGSVISLHRHQGTLYAGTSQGVYFLKREISENTLTNPAHFVPVSGISAQSWSFLSFEDKLLLANFQGVFEIEGGEATMIRPSKFPCLALYRSKKNKQRVFIGQLNGLAAMRFTSEGWVDEGMIPGIKEEVRTIFETDDGRLWLGTDSNGFMRVEFGERFYAEGSIAETKIERFGINEGLPFWIRNNVYTIEGQPVFATFQGIYRFNEAEKRFEPDLRFAKLFPQKRFTVYLSAAADGKIWMNTGTENFAVHETGAAVRKERNYYWYCQPLLRVSDFTVWTILADRNGLVWIGGPDGLICFNSAVRKNYAQLFPAIIRNVEKGRGEAIIFDSNKQAVVLKYSENRLRFDFALPAYDNEKANQFQVILEGIDREWSYWKKENYKEYTNLPEGNYRFRVRGKNVYGDVSPEACFSFKILPPFYRTWWAYLIYFCSAMALFLLLFRWRHSKLLKEQKRLQQLVAEKTQELKELALCDPLTGLRNRRYINEVIIPELNSFINFKKHLNSQSDRRLTREEDKVFAFYLFDLDHFKQINDTYGHDTGDHVLREFSGILKNSIREDDFCIRWGGEEFLVVLKRTNPDYVNRYVAKVRAIVAGHNFANAGSSQHFLKMTCSIGFTVLPFFADKPELVSFEESVMLADLALYHAKHSGRDRAVRIFARNHDFQSESIRRYLSSLEDGISAGVWQIEVIKD